MTKQVIFTTYRKFTVTFNQFIIISYLYLGSIYNITFVFEQTYQLSLYSSALGQQNGITLTTCSVIFVFFFF